MNPFQGEKEFSQGLGFGKNPCLIIIDVLKAYTSPQSPLYSQRYAQVLKKILQLLQLARTHALPIVFTALDYDALHEKGGHFLKKITALQRLTHDPALAALAEGLVPLAGEKIFSKQFASSFFGTSLQSYLNFKKVDSLIITGLSTSGCVRATATDAIQHGYIPMVVMDAVGDRSDEIHQANLYDLQMKYADLYTTEEITEQLKLRNAK